MNKLITLLFFLVNLSLLAQQTKVSGYVKDKESGEMLEFVKVQFKGTKLGATTDSSGFFSIETYYASDTLTVSFPGYETLYQPVKIGTVNTFTFLLSTGTKELQEIAVNLGPDSPAIKLWKKVVANKPINNREKLDSYEYEVYNKVQLDLNNIGDKFGQNKIIQRLDVVMDYLDSTSNEKSYLPVILSESISDYYFKNRPVKKKEVVKATRITGIENLQLNQFVSDMYLDINIYDNNILMFGRSFVSPISEHARNFYKFRLIDSSFIGNNWCYRLLFIPKRAGDLTFEGEMWVADSTYAVKEIYATMSAEANINFVNALYFEQGFEQVDKEVWMMTREKMIVDFRLTEKTKLYGFYGRKNATRKYFKINETHPDDFYNTNSTVTISDSAKSRSDEYWEAHRHIPLSKQEAGIIQMTDSLENTRFFKFAKNFAYFATTGYYPVGYVEIGNLYNIVSTNPVESFRSSLSLRTSNKFSKRLELGGRLAYGTLDQRFKYWASVRYNITPKKRGMLMAYYKYDIEQLGQSPTAASIGSTFGTVFRTGPLDKLTFVEKIGINLEKDIKKDLIVFAGFEKKEYTALGIANYVKLNTITGIYDTINTLRSSEITLRIRWTKDEEFISGYFDRTSVRSKYPIFSLQGIFGVKDLFGGEYNYQKIEFVMEHFRQIGRFGRIRYGVNAGYIFGSAAYPFLKVHEGNQSYWLLTSTFNMLNYYEFISDRYVGALLENHWDGFFFDRIPGVRKLKWRLVTTGRMVYGSISDKNRNAMILPAGTKMFGNVPYAEAAVGIENIFKVGRIDLVYRLTHVDPGKSPIGIRARWAFYF